VRPHPASADFAPEFEFTRWREATKKLGLGTWKCANLKAGKGEKPQKIRKNGGI
jgi:hypothetical protein